MIPSVCRRKWSSRPIRSAATAGTAGEATHQHKAKRKQEEEGSTQEQRNNNEKMGFVWIGGGSEIWFWWQRAGRGFQ
jgi:hypothetical protein